MKSCRLFTFIKNNFDYHEFVVNSWLILFQPLIAYFLPKVNLAHIDEVKWYILAALVMNFFNLFILGILIQNRYIKKGLIAGVETKRGGTLTTLREVLLNPVILILLNGSLTITAITVFIAVYLHSAVLLMGAITGMIVLLIAGLTLIGNLKGGEAFIFGDGMLAGLSVSKDILSTPIIIIAAEIARQFLYPIHLTVLSVSGLMNIAADLLILGPIVYILLVFLLRATVALKVPSKFWIARYVLFILSIIVNTLVVK